MLCLAVLLQVQNMPCLRVRQVHGAVAASLHLEAVAASPAVALEEEADR